MVCSDCHNPHGSTSEFLLTENTANETCFNCHPEKRGPFLWEHPPVQENCTLCHNPHGSTQERMLKIRTPYLCQQCHSEAFHPSTLYDGSGVPPEGAQSRLLSEGCLNCHFNIHGSNHPSGAAFDR
ncbi:MAG: cytochrome c3 family protein [Gammaproteobacteria bacterium]